MFSNETLESCTIIKIENLMPKDLGLSEGNSVIRDGFMFIFRDGKGLRAYMNLGFEPTEAEKESMSNFLMTWGGGEHSEVHNTILEMEFPEFVKPFYERLNAIPGCRIDPNVYHSSGDVYVSVEYNRSVAKEVNHTITDFLIRDHLFSKKLIYSGPQNSVLPCLLQMYASNGNSLGNFLLVKTVWEFDPEQIKGQNDGVLQNVGTYVPKEFSEGQKEALIFKTGGSELKGNSKGQVVSKEDNIVEFNVKSRFFMDFSREVIRRYSGPIFLHIELAEERQVSYYIVERELQIPFLKGLTEYWGKPVRSDHVNYIETAFSLEDAIKK